MATITDRQLMEAGMTSDVILGFRTGMSGRLQSDDTLVAMPEHFREERQRPRIEQFRRGVRIAMTWRQSRTAMGVARREVRNQDFRALGIAYVIDRDETRREAITLLRSAIAHEDGFLRPDAELVHEIATSCSVQARAWDVKNAVCFYEAHDANGLLSTTSSSLIKAMGEWWTSAEALYHAQKFPRDFTTMDRIRDATDAASAKAIAREMKDSRRRDWSTHRTVAMIRTIMTRVEQDPQYRLFLAQTGDRDLVEDTTDGQHDLFWGVVDGSGVNMAGQVAMAVRSAVAAADSRLRIQ